VAFSAAVLGVPKPRVGLLSVGEEPGKGTPTVVEAHRRLADAEVEFAGNVEGDDLPAAAVDVVVTDGFTGNVALKLMEGTARSISAAVREAARSGPLSALGGLMLRPKLAALRRRIDPEEVGGAYLLGLRKLVVICHGNSTRRAIGNAVRLAARGVEDGVVEKTREALVAGGVARGSGSEKGPQGPEAASVGADSVKINR
jgi:glycerol-3-phosphate acyltransferase PlsX